MVTKRANVEYTDQPYFSKAAQRPQRMPADNTNTAPKQERVTNGPWGKARTDYKTNNGPVRSARSTDEIFSDSYAQAGMQPANLNQAPDQTSKARTTYDAPSNVPRVPRTYKNRIPKIKRKKKVSTEKMLLARVRVTTANAWIGSWAAFWYLGFQLPLAIISAAGLAITYAAYAAITAVVGEGVTNFLIQIAAKVTLTVSSLLEALISYTSRFHGIDFDPRLLFITPFALVFLLGLFQLILTWFIYSVMQIKSLSGTAGGLKGVMFVIAGIGYAIPILNMFPLIFLWMIVVWIHPK